MDLSLLPTLIFIEILTCLQTFFQYFKRRNLILVPFHRTIVLLHVYFAGHLIYVLISKLYFPEGGWVENSAPFGLMYGPFIFFLTYTYSRNQWLSVKSLWHMVPWGIFSVIHIVLLVTYVDMYSPTARIYMNVLYFLIPISFLTYGFLAWLNLKSPGSHMGFIFYLLLFVAVMGMGVLGLGMAQGVIQRVGPVIEDKQHELNGYKVYTFLLILMIILNRYATRLQPHPVHRFSGSNLSVLPPPDPETDMVQEMDDLRYEKSGIDDTALDRYEQILDDYIEKHKPWLDPNVNLQILAGQLKISPHHLTQLINTRKNMSYSQYINTKRIEFACELLKNREPELTFEKIGYECGFNSKATFYRWFKNIKSMSPSEFLETLE